jgi:hypothetical protein
VSDDEKKSEPKKEPAPANQQAPAGFMQSPWAKAILAGAVVAGVGYLYRASNKPTIATMENIVATNLALTNGSASFDGVPACDAPGPQCLEKLSTYMGSKSGFHSDKPDQASCAAVAVVVVRDKRGDSVPDANAWQNMLKIGKGAGVDTLRLSVARAMAAKAPDVGQHFDDEESAKKLLGAVAASIPGACETYGAIARGDALEKMPPEIHPDHSACVQRDLTRREGPGGRYGTGVFRAAEGAAAMWRDEERALRIGSNVASPAVQKVVTEMLTQIEPMTLKIAIKKVESADEQAMVGFMAEVHADAGVLLMKLDGGVPEGGLRNGIPTRFPQPPH